MHIPLYYILSVGIFVVGWFLFGLFIIVNACRENQALANRVAELEREHLEDSVAIRRHIKNNMRLHKELSKNILV